VKIKRAAIIHSIISALAIVPAIGLAIGIPISAANSNTGALAYVAIWLSVLFPVVLALSIVVVWIAYATQHLGVVRVAIAFPWTYCMCLIVATGLLITLARSP
jgi:hypothetical protein